MFTSAGAGRGPRLWHVGQQVAAGRQGAEQGREEKGCPGSIPGGQASADIEELPHAGRSRQEPARQAEGLDAVVAIRAVGG